MTDDSASFDVIAQLPALRRYGLALTRNATEAEDLVNEALLRAYEKRASFRPERNLRVWLLAILHNCFIDAKRRQRADEIKLLRAGEQAERHAQPAQEHALRLAQVRQAFMSLPDEHRAALHLVAIEGLGYQEAAATLGIPTGTLMSRLGRARAALRLLEEKGAAPAASRSGHLRIVGGTDDTAD